MEPNDRLSVILEAQQWNVVLAQLAEGPYRVMAPIINELQQQCLAQQRAEEQPEPQPQPQPVTQLREVVSNPAAE
jgi:hypothetical protein